MSRNTCCSVRHVSGLIGSLKNILLGLFALACTSSMAEGACPVSVQIMSSDSYRVSVGGSVVKSILPSFFGFNLAAPAFQLSLFDRTKDQVRREIITYMRAFPGAVYRYPGGTTANLYDWQDGVGPVTERPRRSLVTWHAPMVNAFGFHEYLNFVAQVHGEAWLVANLYGNMQGEKPLHILTASARAWAIEAKQDQAKGMPSILRWELGNELYKEPTRWTSAEYNKQALAIAAAIRSADPHGRFVTPLEEYATKWWLSYEDYNVSLAQALAPYTPDYAQHLYVDGPKVSLIPNALSILCNNINAISNAGQADAGYWITEFAAAPTSWQNFNRNSWGSVANMGAALSIADMVIGLSQIPQVKGAFLHSLTGVGPWSLFYKDSNGVYQPTLPYWALRLLRSTMLDEVLTTYTQSPNKGNYAGGYDLRATVLTDATQQKYALWGVNRANQPINVQLRIPNLAGRTMKARLTVLHAADLGATDGAAGDSVLPTQENFSLSFDAVGNSRLQIPAHAVAALLLSP